MPPVSIAAEGHSFRFVRLTATKLAERSKDYMLALAEIGAGSDGAGLRHGLGFGRRRADESGGAGGAAGLSTSFFGPEGAAPDTRVRRGTIARTAFGFPVATDHSSKEKDCGTLNLRASTSMKSR